MAQSHNTRRPAPQSGLQQWFTDGGNRLEQLKKQAEVKGRQIYEEAIRTGRPILAKTTEELRELGAKALVLEQKTVKAGSQIAHNAASAAKHPHSPEAQRLVRNLKNQATAVVHGAGDAFTFGLDDKASAGVRALLDSGGDLSQVRDLYHHNMEGERAQDQYEQQNYRAARMAGQVVGTVGQLAVAGPLGELAQVARLGRAVEAAIPVAKYVRIPQGVRVAGATRMTPSEYVALAGVGGASGAAMQAVTDGVQGHLSSWRDLGGAAAGGAAQGLLGIRLGPISNGALGGAGTSMLKDELNGRPISIENAALSGAVGGAGGAIGGLGAVEWAGRLPALNGRRGVYTMGKLGDDLSVLRSMARLDPPTSLRKTMISQPGDPRSFRDYGTAAKEVEAKYGMGATLSPNQEIAHAALGGRSQIDSFIPQDVANIAGIPFSQLLARLVDLDNNRRKNDER
jgi:hypothetical protein